MTVPLWCLLAFAAWTLLVLVIGVGVRRWSLILTGRAELSSFPADTPHGSDAYRRAMRAHANCVENLPVYGAIIVCGHLAGVHTSVDALLAQAVVGARLGQSVIHMSVPQTNVVVGIRFTFLAVQLIAMTALIARIVFAAA